ncbi:hypothetical protein [Bradyrhizobium sp. BR 10289]|uniref:hypothetical protein n=1 Tax=Bradyrhizobium sp. BR 10289 TaxID=2749993 RepID=UPI001C64CEF5|nr:hypothetical protein [Bradyrhizobium sp. BR 10289]MBW7970973.1 hypothetical protein [Bradyrhizobium sp. BR 10289]
MADVPQIDQDVLDELAWASEGERWEGNDDERFNGFTVHQANLLDTWDHHHDDEVIFSMDAHPGRFFRLRASKGHSSGDHEIDDYVTEVFPHTVTAVEYREQRAG